MTELMRLLWDFEAEAQGLICAFTPDGRNLIAGAEDGTIYAFNRGGQLLWQQRIDGEAFRFALSRRSNILAIGTIRGADTSVLNFETGELLWKFTGEAQTKAGVGVTEDGARIFSGDDSGKVRCFSRSGQLLWLYDCRHKKISRLSVTPSGHRVVFGGNDHIYCLNGSGDLLWTYRTGGEVWAGARILPDGSYVIGGSNDQYVYMLDGSGNLVWRYQLGGNVNITYPTADGAFIAVGSTDSCAYLLSGDGQLLWKYRTGDSIYGISLSANAEFVAVASYDRHIYLFNREGDLLEKLRTGNQVYVVDITPDGRFIGSFGFDKRVYLLENAYAAHTEEERAEVQSILKRRLIAKVRNAFVENIYYGLCYWFDQFSQLLRRNAFELCEALIAEARQEGYPFMPAEQRFVDSREGAIYLKRGIVAQRQGDLEAAERFYNQAIALQRRAGCPICQEQAQLALRFLAEERLSGWRDPLLDKIHDEVRVLGGGEAFLIGRLASAPPDQLPLIIRAAAKIRLIKPLLQALASNDRRLQMLAIATLNRFNDIGDLTPIVTALQHENPFVRWQAASMLSRQKTLPPELVQRLPELIAAEHDPDTRRVLVELAAHLKLKGLTPLLLPLLKEPDNDLRWSAVVALGKIGDRSALPALREVAEGYTLTELSIGDALRRATRDIVQRFPLPEVNRFHAMHWSQAEPKAATIFWKGEAVLFVISMGSVSDEVRFTFALTDQDEVVRYKVSLSYAEFLDSSDRLRAEAARRTQEQRSDRLGTSAIDEELELLELTPPVGTSDLREETEDTEDFDFDTDDEIPQGIEDEDELDETAAERPTSDSETHSRSLWIFLPADVTQTLQPGIYTANLYVYHQLSGQDEPIGSLKVHFIDRLRVENAVLSLSDTEPSAHVQAFAEYAESVYLTLRLAQVPLGTELRVEVWYGSAGSGELILSETRFSDAESYNRLQFCWQQARWRIGRYTACLLVRSTVAPSFSAVWSLTFEVEPYRYERWEDLPNDAPALWKQYGRHLVESGRADKLIRAVKDLRYIARKTTLCLPPDVEADLNLAAAYAPDDKQLAALRREYARISHILSATHTDDEIEATLALWLGNSLELRALTESYERSLPEPRITRWHSLPTAHPALMRVLRGHTDAVSDCAFSADGRFVATASEDASVRLWDVHTGALRLNMPTSGQSQYSCDISRDGKWLISGGRQRMSLWDIERGVCVRRFGQNDPIFSVNFHPDNQRVLAVSDDNTIRLWNAHTGQELHCATMPPSQAPRAVAYNADGSLFCSAHVDGSLRIRRTDTFEVISQQELPMRHLCAVAFSPDDHFIAVGSENHSVMIVDAFDQEPARSLQGHTSEVHAVAFSPGGNWLASGGADGKLYLWQWRTQETPHLTLHDHLRAVRSLAFSPDGKYLVSASEDREARVWDVQLLLQRLEAHPRSLPMWHGALSADGRLILSDSGNRLVLWDVASGQIKRIIQGAHQDDILCCAISPNGAWALSGGRDQNLRLWSLATGRDFRTKRVHEGAILRCAISPDGEWFASVSDGGVIRLWDFPNARELGSRSIGRGQLNCCAISPDGRHIAIVGSNGTVRLWRFQDGSDPVALDQGDDHDSILTCTFSPDGRYLATGGCDKNITVWDVRSHRPIVALSGHTANVQAIAFSPNGEWLLSGAQDGNVRLWHWYDERCLHSLFINRAVTNCAFLPDGQRIMLSSGSGLYLLRLEL